MRCVAPSLRTAESNEHLYILAWVIDPTTYTLPTAPSSISSHQARKSSGQIEEWVTVTNGYIKALDLITWIQRKKDTIYIVRPPIDLDWISATLPDFGSAASSLDYEMDFDENSQIPFWNITHRPTDSSSRNPLVGTCGTHTYTATGDAAGIPMLPLSSFRSPFSEGSLGNTDDEMYFRNPLHSMPQGPIAKV